MHHLIDRMRAGLGVKKLKCIMPHVDKNQRGRNNHQPQCQVGVSSASRVQENHRNKRTHIHKNPKKNVLLLPRLTRCRLHLRGQNGIEYSGYQLPLHLPLWPSSPSFSLVYSPKGNNPLSPTASVLSSFSLFQFKLHNYPKP